jgi:hypothetical protein
MNRLIQFKSSRWAAMLVATVVAIITSAVVANATQTITTPNAAFVSWSLAPGANSAAITPATNRWVLVGGCCTTTSIPSVGQASLLHLPGTYIVWVGLESASTSGSAITQGASGTTGHHIVYIDFVHTVDIQVNSADTIRVHNGNAVTQAGNVTLIW